MESGYEVASACTYKATEIEIRSILLPRGSDPLTITAKDIRNATHRIVQSKKTPMTESSLSKLLYMKKQRRTVFHQFYNNGSLCHGHLYRIELWETVHNALQDHFNAVASRDVKQTTEQSNKALNDASIRGILKRLDEEAGRIDKSDNVNSAANVGIDRSGLGSSIDSGRKKKEPRPNTSFNQVHEEVLLATSLDCIRSIGNWLRRIWGDVAESRLDFATVAQLSNCARELVQREYHEIDLLYGWSKHSIFKQHPLALEIEKIAETEAWRRLIAFRNLNKSFLSPVFKNISDYKLEIKDKVSIDIWLVLGATEAWFEVSGSKHPELPTAKMFLLLRILRAQLNQLRAQMPNTSLGRDIDTVWIKSAERTLDVAQREILPPPWGLCDLASQIVSKRWEIEAYSADTLAFCRINDTYWDDTAESAAIRDWLLDRYQDRLYPTGRPRTRAEASLPTNTRLNSTCYRVYR